MAGPSRHHLRLGPDVLGAGRPPDRPGRSAGHVPSSAEPVKEERGPLDRARGARYGDRSRIPGARPPATGVAVMTHPEPVDSMVFPRHSGICTFMRLPHTPDTRLLDVAFVGVPFDTSAGYRVGARLAPRTIRYCSSQVRIHHPLHDVTVHRHIRIADYGDVRTTPFE